MGKGKNFFSGLTLFYVLFYSLTPPLFYTYPYIPLTRYPITFSSMATYKPTLEHDGTAYTGWQRQTFDSPHTLWYPFTRQTK